MVNNTNEFLDETKPLEPTVQKGINASKAVNEPVRASPESVESPDNEGIELENKTAFEPVDFTCTRGLVENAEYFVRMQDASNEVFHGLRVPYCSDNFRRTVVPKSRAGVPVLPYDYYISGNGVTGGGATTFSRWMNTKEETYFNDFIIDERPFKVKMSDKLKAELMTKVAIWSNEYLDKGVRDSRARPNAILGDWAWALTPTFSMTHRVIRTDIIATWMYGTYVPGSPVTKITIINASDLRTFMNTGDGNYWPVEQNTLCLALGKTTTTNLEKLVIFAHPVIIDFDSSMSSSRGISTTYNGVQAYEVTCNTTVNPCDLDVSKIINNTFSGIDIQWAIYANTLPLTNFTNGCIFGTTTGTSYNLRVYENSICDQFINFYATKRDTGNQLPVTTNRLSEFIQAWRLYKTATVDRVIVELGVVGYAGNNFTYGKAITYDNFVDLISGCFEAVSLTAGISRDNYPLWIPYEMWVSNGANIQLDKEDYVDGQSPVLVNTIYLAPRSQVVVDLTTWADTSITTVQLLDEYYVPNADSAVFTINKPSTATYTQYCSCIPSTVPRYSSTSETMTLPWVKSQTIDFSFSASGHNDNTVFRKKLVFSSAVKN